MWARSLGLWKLGLWVWSLFYQCWEAIGEIWARKCHHLSSISEISHRLMDVFKNSLKRCGKNESWAVAYFLYNLQFTENCCCCYHHVPPHHHSAYTQSSGLIWPPGGQHRNCLILYPLNKNTNMPEIPWNLATSWSLIKCFQVLLLKVSLVWFNYFLSVFANLKAIISFISFHYK